MGVIGNATATPWAQWLGRVRDLLDARGVHPSRAVVLLPYAQLMPIARRHWAGLSPEGFAPRFETTMDRAGRHAAEPGPEDISFDRGRDLVTARGWLERAGLGAKAAVLAGRLVDAAWQVAGCVAAIPPADRDGWARDARPALSAGLDSPELALEAAVARIALEWALATRHPRDVLFDEAAWNGVDLLVACEGLQPDPLAQALADRLGDRGVRLPLPEAAAPGEVRVHACADPADEAERAAACVLRHLEAGRAPVALAAIDRGLTRRIRAMLGVRRVSVRDETGWKLSTTRAAAQVMGLLQASRRTAASDDVLAWLKDVPALLPSSVDKLERNVRRNGWREWHDVSRLAHDAPWGAAVPQVDGWREPLQAPRALSQWQAALREALQSTGAWAALQRDEAGQQVLQVLGLDDVSLGLWREWPQGARRLGAGEFIAWAADTLESASFIPPAPREAQVVILPFAQIVARDFAAVVLAGCDEARLPAAPEPPGAWTRAQRAALGLPARETLAREQALAWRHALAMPVVDVLWRTADGAGEPVLPSPLVQGWTLGRDAAAAADPRVEATFEVRAIARPQAIGSMLPIERLSASAYEDLRRCPYRFFALRQLGLQEANEIDVELDKRDFGTWLHLVLREFHEADAQAPGGDRAALLERCADAAARRLGLAHGEFLPFRAAWPQVRDGYLDWLQQHEAQGWRFASAETDHAMPLERWQLIGRIDRIDTGPDGQRMVIDYKTEGLNATRERVKVSQEDTQLAFYAALLEDDELAAAYVNVGERGETVRVQQDDVVAARDALLDGIRHDLGRIADGVPLQALGEGRACEFCAARGLCRKDGWHD
jgi:ATP-dependent helicase/nuclease subunit B